MPYTVIVATEVYTHVWQRLASVFPLYFIPQRLCVPSPGSECYQSGIFLFAELFLSFLGHTVTCGMGEFKVGRRFSRRITNINNALIVNEKRLPQTMGISR